MLRSTQRVTLALAALPLLAALGACGRTQGLGEEGDGRVIRPDFGPFPDFAIPDGPRLDRFPPPPDFRPFPDLPRPFDFGPMPDFPRPPDFGPNPDFPFPPDFGPPPDFSIPKDVGPIPDLPPNCSPSCVDLCGVAAGTCGVLPAATCVAQCATWTPQQFGCVAAEYCKGQTGGPPPDCGKVKSCVAPPTLADLTVSKFTAAVNGSTVTYTIEVCNLGGAASTQYFVDVYYNRPTAPGLQQFGEQFNQFPALGAKACRSNTFTRNNTAAGTYSSWAQVDADGQVSESNESNNVRGPLSVTVQGTPQGPDLVVDSLTATVTGTTLATVRYTARVCNKGTQQSPTSQVHVYYNRTTAPATGQLGDRFTTVQSLAPGACTNRQIFRSGTPPGTYASWAQVDPSNTIAEAVETNNVAGPTTVTVGSTKGADLTIKSLTTQVFGSSSVRYRAEVCNTGTGSSGATTVVVYYNRATAPAVGANGDQLTTVPQLAPGACTTRSIFRSGTPPGTYTSWAQVDVPNVVTETSEANNIAGPVKVTVGSTAQLPDLRFTQFTAQAFGDKVNYSMVVCNFGQASAGVSRVDLYYNSPFPPSSAGNFSQSLSPLSVGACQTINHSRLNTPTGTYSSWVRVDRLGQVQESNENNNTRGPVSVTVGTPPVPCTTACLSAIQCGLFQPTQFSACTSWCGSLSSTQKSCVDKAVNASDCNALKLCAPVPPPPPPPPPGFCSDICKWLETPCNLLPAGQQATCLSLCAGLTPTQVTCAQNARNANQCFQALLCLNSP
jgi:subtilase family serine protease